MPIRIKGKIREKRGVEHGASGYDRGVRMFNHVSNGMYICRRMCRNVEEIGSRSGGHVIRDSSGTRNIRGGSHHGGYVRGERLLVGNGMYICRRMNHRCEADIVNRIGGIVIRSVKVAREARGKEHGEKDLSNYDWAYYEVKVFIRIDTGRDVPDIRKNRDHIDH